MVGCHLPGGSRRLTQGETIEEARVNLKDAVELVLEVMREDAERELEGKEGVIRETLEV
jgi:predicted RNase H-like HicB family nuclease